MRGNRFGFYPYDDIKKHFDERNFKKNRSAIFVEDASIIHA